MPNTKKPEELPITPSATVTEPGVDELAPTSTKPATVATPARGGIGNIGALPQYGLLLMQGEDAISFLHSQLTNDIKSLATGHACLAGYCTPKGRLLASMVVWKSKDEIFLQLPVAIMPEFHKRLHMFIMRAKVTIKNSSDSTSILGISDHLSALNTSDRNGVSLLTTWLGTWFPELPDAPYKLVTNTAGTLLRVADACGKPRYQWIATTEQARQALALGVEQFGQLSPEVWDWTEIQSGTPHILPQTKEKFVPQMVNYDVINAVNFRKGCYPGQEIVARSQYLGKQKRRMVLASIESSSVEAGDEVFASTDPGQPCGTIVNAQPGYTLTASGLTAKPGTSDCLIVLKTDITDAFTHTGADASADAAADVAADAAAKSGHQVVQLSNGSVCHWLPMPYAVTVEPA